MLEMYPFTTSCSVLSNTPGIYMITNIQNNKVYVGSSSNIRIRFVDHRKNLRGNRHCSAHLQAAFNLYKEEIFIFTVLEKDLTQDILEEREQHYIDYYKSFDPTFGYNIRKIAFSNKGVSKTEEYKNKRAEEYAVDDYIVTTPEGEEIETKVLRKFNVINSKTGLKEKESTIKITLRALALGKRYNLYHGWDCRFKDEQRAKKIQQIRETNKITNLLANQQRAKLMVKTLECQWKITSPDNTIQIVTNLSLFFRINNWTNPVRSARNGRYRVTINGKYCYYKIEKVITS